ncbi:hypothetical protein ACFVTP_27620 [Streptomyces celluloflavus]|uniref:hypothetical protein n=1 Tax=Streptomyces celluloflavus TaxID=58344 RepID=UPI00365C7C96
MTRPAGGGETHNSPTTHGDHSIAANDIKNVIIKWVLHPSARWLPLLLACAALVTAASLRPAGPVGGFAGWGSLAGVALATAVIRVLIRKPRHTSVIAALSLVSVLSTVGGWLAFQDAVAHREIDVTGQLRLEGRQPLDGGPHNALTLRLGEPALKESRDALRLTLALTDHDPAGPTCVQDTSATVALLVSGVEAQETDLRPGGTVDFTLGAQTSSVEIHLALHTAHGCRMDVRTARAVLHDT